MNRLLFLDCETTGLDPNSDLLLEVGMVVVETPTFEVKAEESRVFHFDLKPTLTKDHHFKGPGRDLFIHRKVVDMHKANGLWEACKRSQLVDYQKLDELLRQFIVDNGCDGSVLAGANPSFDRDFLKKFCPTTARGLHYRNFDTNTFWLLQGFITGEDMRREKPATHRAVDDCKDAVGVVEKHFDFFQKLVGGG
jgi:oligoribonuclease